MSVLQPLSRSSQLRESYIEISRFLRSRVAVRNSLLFESSLSSRCHCLFSTSSRRTLHPSFVPRFQSSSPALKEGDDSPPQEKSSPQAEPEVSVQLQRLFQTYYRRNQFRVSHMSWDKLWNAGPGARVLLYGYLTSQRLGSKTFRFATLTDPTLRRAIQLVTLSNLPEQGTSNDTLAQESGSTSQASDTAEKENIEAPSSEDVGSPDAADIHSVTGDIEEPGTRQDLMEIMENIAPHTPVCVVGFLTPKSRFSDARISSYTDKYVGEVEMRDDVEVRVRFVAELNDMAAKVIPKHGATLGPHERHLQFRTDSELRHRIRQRSRAMALFRKALFIQGFDEVETPALFKSTPEGAREFIVPTRQPGLAYALPQSPQQYKQMLMASGVHRYFQFAKCFRDEDLRADRQPEFTQLDLEMSFTSSRMVMKLIEDVLLQSILPVFRPDWVEYLEKRQRWKDRTETDKRDEQVQIVEHEHQNKTYKSQMRLHLGRKTELGSLERDLSLAFVQLHYDDAMKHYGSDKPDLRIPGRIHRVDDWVPKTLKGMLTSLENPIIEMFKVSMRGADPESSRTLVSSFMESPVAIPYINNPHGTPGVTVFDPHRPLKGLASFGHDAAAKIEEHFQLQSGDVLIVQARPRRRISGSSTVIGNMRVDFHNAAIEKGFLLPLIGFYPVWVTDFPLFTKGNDRDDGCTGAAGLCATHHPFTAPKLQRRENLLTLLSDPVAVKGDHFDLVINGVEVGGGSHRIHDGEMQEFILRDVLKLKPEVIENFRHLLDALKHGCPPHTGFALGFDRLMALLTGASSIRDVIAFPKYGDGVDHAVKAPAPITTEQLSTYHLAISDSVQEDEPRKVSIKA